jgi:hypothetical protein
MPTRYVCDFCGYQGSDPQSAPVDQIQCPMCGEPVTRCRSRAGRYRRVAAWSSPYPVRRWRTCAVAQWTGPGSRGGARVVGAEVPRSGVGAVDGGSGRLAGGRQPWFPPRHGRGLHRRQDAARPRGCRPRRGVAPGPPPRGRREGTAAERACSWKGHAPVRATTARQTGADRAGENELLDQIVRHALMNLLDGDRFEGMGDSSCWQTADPSSLPDTTWTSTAGPDLP